MSNFKYVKPIILVDKDAKTRWHGLPLTVKFEKCEEVIHPHFSSALGKLNIPIPVDEVAQLEKDLGLPVNGLNPVRSNTFLISRKSKLTGQTKVFNMDNASEKLEFYICKGDPRVASSIADYKQGKFPKAKYVIVDEESDAKVESDKIKTEVEAYRVFESLSPEDISKYLKVLGKDVKYTALNVGYAKLGEYVKSNPKEFLRVCGIDKRRLNVIAKLADYVQANLVRKKEKALYYGDTQIGFDRDSAVDFLLNPENAGIVEQLNKNLDNINKKLV